MADINLLVINPGSTSTKIAIYENGKEIERKNLSHPTELVNKYPTATDQSDFRQEEVEKFLKETGYDVSKFTAIACRGGSLPPCHMGAYIVNDEMIDVLCNRPSGQHASSCAAIIGYRIAKKLGIKAYIYDGNCADEMDPVARISGNPLVEKLSMGHFLNTKAVGRMYGKKIGRKYEDMNLIIVHTGGGISIGLHKKGVIVDVASDEDGTMSPERSGGLPSVGWARVCASGKYSLDELCAMVRGKGGLSAYLGTNNVMEVEERIANGDDYAELIYHAMVYKTSKWVGAMAAAAAETIDAIIVTGGIARSELFNKILAKHVGFIAPIDIIPGEYEMEALAAGVTRVLKGEEIAREYREDEKIR